MSYIINKTDGSVLTEITDGTVDQSATDLTLIGKNSSSYGEFYNENLVHLLENFANTSPPNNPIQGQVWYDTNEGRLKVYDGNGFKVSGGTIVSTTAPSTIAQGDLWIDSTNQQMYFNDGNATVLVGPLYKSSQGYSGFQVLDVVDVDSLNHSVVLLYVAQALIGIFSKDEFTPATEIPGFVGDVRIGFNVANNSSIKFRVPVLQADSLLASDGTTKTVENFLSTTDDSVTTGILTIQNARPLIIGPQQNAEFRFETLEYQLNSNVSNQNFQISSLNANGNKPSFYIDSENERVGIYTNAPSATLDVNGNVAIAGNLVVNGTTTTIATNNIVVADKNIILANGVTTDGAENDGGGITVKGTVDKTFAWDLTTEAWKSSENINLPFDKAIMFNDLVVLTIDSAPLLNSAPNLTEIGALTGLTVDKLVFDVNSITYTNAIDVNGSIIIAPKGAGTVDVSSKKITSLADPDAGTDTDAVNVGFLNTTVRSAPLGFVLPDYTGLTDNQVALIVTDVFPVASGPLTLREEGTVCRVHCVSPTRIVKQFVVSSGVWTFDGDESSLLA